MSATASSPATGQRLTGRGAVLIWLVVVVDLTAALGRYLGAPLTPDMPPSAFLLFLVMMSSFGLVGALIVTRRRHNPVGWILWVAATLLTVCIVSDLAAYHAVNDPAARPWAVPVAWLGSFLFVPTIGMVLVFVPLSFPDGHLLSRRWRWVVVFSAIAIVVSALPSMFSPGPLSNAQGVANPVGIPGFERLVPVLNAANVLMVAVAFPLAIAAAVLRYRRGSSVERQQLKWFAAAVGLTGVCFGLAVLVPEGPVAELGWIVGLVGMTTVPIAIGIAILRYRLYDIDRIISRTIGYLVVTGILALVFVAAVLLLGAILAPQFGENPIAVAVSTLIVAALFQPLRRRVQTVVDRRFNRARYDAQRTADAFATRLREQVDLAAVAGDLVATVDASLQPTRSGVWLREAAD